MDRNRFLRRRLNDLRHRDDSRGIQVRFLCRLSRCMEGCGFADKLVRKGAKSTPILRDHKSEVGISACAMITGNISAELHQCKSRAH